MPDLGIAVGLHALDRLGEIANIADEATGRRVAERLELAQEIPGSHLASWAGIPVHAKLDVEGVGPAAVGDSAVGHGWHLCRDVSHRRDVRIPAGGVYRWVGDRRVGHQLTRVGA